MNTIDLMKRRVSIRKFNDKPIEEKHMDEILACAIQAPTAGNMVPYSIIKIKSKETLKKLSESCDHQPFIASADTALIFIADMSKWYRYLILNDVKDYAERTNRHYDGPTIADAVLAINDALIASENAVIAAEELGIGSCYIGDIMENFEYHKELLNLPEHCFPATMLVLGHYDHQPGPRYRFDKKYIVFDEKYDALTDDDIHDMFSQVSALYNPYKSDDIKNYAQQFYNRKLGAPFFEEMNRSLKCIFSQYMKSTE